MEPAHLIVTALRDVALFSPSQILPTHRSSGLFQAVAQCAAVHGSHPLVGFDSVTLLLRCINIRAYRFTISASTTDTPSPASCTSTGFRSISAMASA